MQILDRLQRVTDARPRITVILALVASFALTLLLEPAARSLTRFPDYVDEAAKTLSYTLLAPLAVLAGLPFLWYLARELGSRPATLLSCYKAALAAFVLSGAVMALAWMTSALFSSLILGMLLGVPIALLAMSWSYGQFLRDREGNRFGFRVGARMVGVTLLIVIAILVVTVVLAFIAVQIMVGRST